MSEQTVQNARKALVILNTIFIVMALGSSVFTFYQEKRRWKLIEAEKENVKKSEQLSKQAQELLAPMNEISELMYVSDMDTYELLFVNEAGKRKYFRLMTVCRCKNVIKFCRDLMSHALFVRLSF